MVAPQYGEYQVVRPLGSGGMGQVLLARSSVSGREVALKVLHPEVASRPVANARFRREVEAMRRLAHPGIVPVLDFALLPTPDGYSVPCLLMEYVASTSLRQLLQERGPLPVAEALRLGSDVADILGHAHSAGVIHRDVKPENVLVEPSGAVRVVDFGLAILEGPAHQDLRLSQGLASADDRLTRAGAVLGTLEYMAPEQRRGEPVDARADVYALGVVLHEMITGAFPEIGVSLADLRPDAPEGLEEILHRALTARDRRYPTAEELAEDLRELALNPARKRPPLRGGRARPPVLRPKQLHAGVPYVLWALSFIGFCGIHRMYLERPISGLLYFFTFGLCFVGQLIDLLLIPGMTAKRNQALQEAFERRYGRHLHGP